MLDEESGRFVVYLAQRLEGLPILLMAGARPPATPDTFNLPDYSLLLSNIPYSNAGMTMGTAMPPAATTGTRPSTRLMVVEITASRSDSVSL